MKKNILLFLFLILISLLLFPTTEALGDYVQFLRIETFNNHNYAVGIGVSGFHDKVLFINIYKDNFSLSSDKTTIDNGNCILSEMINEKIDRYGKTMNHFESVSIDFKNGIITIEFDDKTQQVITTVF